jgi:hypothetical protein
MAENSQFATARRSSSAPDRPIWDIVSRAEQNAQAAANARIHMAWPILVLGVSAVSTLAWAIFLVWKAAASILQVVT